MLAEGHALLNLQVTAALLAPTRIGSLEQSPVTIARIRKDGDADAGPACGGRLLPQETN